jgi:serine/threonine protein kinase
MRCAKVVLGIALQKRIRKMEPASIDKYEISSVLGSGATSTVYLAHDAFAGRQVAIKVFRSSILSDPKHGHKYRKLIANEASLAGRLNHPHIVAIHDAVLGQDKCYIVMEYVEGETLEKYGLPESLLPVEKVIEIIFKCALALDFANRNGVIHRDIKLANIMMCRNGDIKIADFGSAVLTRSDQTELVGVGSPAFMSPEQIRQQSLTQQTDIYSLGVVMYMLLTGRMPFEAENSYALSHKILNDEPIGIRSLRPALPLMLEKIVAKAMGKKLENRYSRWRDFAQDLSNFAALELPRETVSETEKFNTMRSLSFFQEFNDTELWEVLRISVWIRAPVGTCLVREGEEGNFFFIVTDGEVKVSREGKTLGIEGAGHCFGEMCYIRHGSTTRTATVMANSPVTLLKIKPESLMNASENCQFRFDHAFLITLVERLTQADIQLASMQ